MEGGGVCVQAEWCAAALVQSEAECVWFEAVHLLSSVVRVCLETQLVGFEVHEVLGIEVACFLSV